MKVFDKPLLTKYGRYTELKVLKSAAGYYLGRLFDEGDFMSPGSRESGYFKTEEEAKFALANGFEWRDCMENQSLYENSFTSSSGGV